MRGTSTPSKGTIEQRTYSTDWNLQNNHKRDWFHAPWQHFGRNGREGIHGLTREATAQPKQLAPSQVDPFDTYAVGFYNKFGGYTIGQVWHEHYHPDKSPPGFPLALSSVRFCSLKPLVSRFLT